MMAAEEEAAAVEAIDESYEAAPNIFSGDDAFEQEDDEVVFAVSDPDDEEDGEGPPSANDAGYEPPTITFS